MRGDEHTGWARWKLRPALAVLAVSFCLTFYGLGFTNTFSAADLATWPFIIGGIAGLVAGGVGAWRDPGLLDRILFFNEYKYVWTFALFMGATGAFAAAAFALTTNRFVSLHEYEQRILTVSAFHKGVRGSGTTVFRSPGRCCFWLKENYGPVGTQYEFRMRRGLWGYYHYTDYRRVGLAKPAAGGR